MKNGCLVFWPRPLLPLVEAVGRDDAPALLERRLVGVLRGQGLGPGVDHLRADLRVLGPAGHEPPVEGVEVPGGAVGQHGVDVIGRGDVVATARAGPPGPRPRSRPPPGRAGWRRRSGRTSLPNLPVDGRTGVLRSAHAALGVGGGGGHAGRGPGLRARPAPGPDDRRRRSPARAGSPRTGSPPSWRCGSGSSAIVGAHAVRRGRGRPVAGLRRPRPPRAPPRRPARRAGIDPGRGRPGDQHPHRRRSGPTSTPTARPRSRTPAT